MTQPPPANRKEHQSQANLLIPSRSYSIVIFTNQAGLKDPKKDSTIVTKFKIKVAAILDALDIPLKLYAATARDDYRRPRTGMWYEMLRSYQLSGAELDLAASFLVGDAAGREGDHSDSDRLMAPARSVWFTFTFFYNCFTSSAVAAQMSSENVGDRFTEKRK